MFNLKILPIKSLEITSFFIIAINNLYNKGNEMTNTPHPNLPKLANDFAQTADEVIDLGILSLSYVNQLKAMVSRVKREVANVAIQQSVKE
jgi:hypothetical protein